MNQEIYWHLYPRNKKIPNHLFEVISIFEKNSEMITSEKNTLASNDVLKILEKDLQDKGYKVETGKKQKEKIKVPVLFGQNGLIEKGFDADGVNIQTKTVIEIEAGRAVTNYQFLKDLFQATVMIDIDYLIIAVRNDYHSKKDFLTVCKFMDVLYSSDKLILPLKAILIIGY